MQASNDATQLTLDPVRRPFPFGRVTLRNRCAMSPMTRQFSPGGLPGPDVAAYYAVRAAAGVGLIITEGVYVDHPSAGKQDAAPALRPDTADAWRQVVDAVHEQGGAIIPQLWHVGNYRRVAAGDPAPGLGPEAITEAGETVVLAMNQADIDATIAAFARSARIAIDCGFDGVEIHGGHGYMLDQFHWERTNNRQDAYGGTLENRFRLSCEVVRAVRAEIGPDWPIVFRLSQWKMSDYEARILQDVGELQQVAAMLTEAGVDVFDISARRFWLPAFEEGGPSLAALFRAASGRPVIAVGSVGLDKPSVSRHERTAETMKAVPVGIENASAALAAGEFDLFAAGRTLLADPRWLEKILAGRLEELVPVTSAAYARLVT